MASETPPETNRWARALVLTPWPGIGMLVCGGVTTIAVATFGETENEGARDGSSVQGWGVVLLLGAIVVAILGVLLLSNWSERRKYRRGNRAAQIERLTTTLKEALIAADAIRLEVEQGNRTLAELEQRSEMQRELANLSQREAEAVRAALRAEFRAERRSTLVRDLTIGALFFIMGIIATLLTRS